MERMIKVNTVGESSSEVLINPNYIVSIMPYSKGSLITFLNESEMAVKQSFQKLEKTLRTIAI